MNVQLIEPGDVVHAANDLINDGSHPKFEPEAVVVAAGTRGVVVRMGHAQLDERLELLLVRFEQPDGVLGPPIGCWPDEVVSEPGAEPHQVS